MVDIQHRSQIARVKFNEHGDTLLNPHVPLRLRLKLFDSVITPTMLFGLMTWPLTSNQLQKLEVVWKRMLRSIVGWGPLVDNDWHALMQKMNKNLENAQQIFNIRPWTETLLVGSFVLQRRLHLQWIPGPFLHSEWYPLPEVAHELLCRTSPTNWSPSETLGWSNWIFCTGKLPLIMVSGSQMWDMELSWESFCTVVLGTLMFGCSSFPCPSWTVALTGTGFACVSATLSTVSVKIKMSSAKRRSSKGGWRLPSTTVQNRDYAEKKVRGKNIHHGNQSPIRCFRHFSAHARQSFLAHCNTAKNRRGLRTHPCRTPALIGKTVLLP